MDGRSWCSEAVAARLFEHVGDAAEFRFDVIKCRCSLQYAQAHQSRDGEDEDAYSYLLVFPDPLHIHERQAYDAADECRPRERHHDRRYPECYECRIHDDVLVRGEEFFYALESLSEEHHDDRQERDEEISVIVRTGEDALPSQRSLVSGEIVDRRLISEGEILERAVAYPMEELRYDQFRYLPHESCDDDDNESVDQSAQELHETILILLICQRISHAYRGDQDDEVSQSVFDPYSDIVSWFPHPSWDAYAEEQERSERDERISPGRQERFAVFDMRDSDSDEEYYPYAVPDERKQFLILSSENPVAEDGHDDMIEDYEDEKNLDESQHGCRSG